MFTLREIVKLVVYDQRDVSGKNFCVDNNKNFLRSFSLIILVKSLDKLSDCGLCVHICCKHTFDFLFFSNNSLHKHTHTRGGYFSCAAQDENL